MSRTSCGSCCGCGKHLVYLVWRHGKRIIVVSCENCQLEVPFDLDTMVEILGSQDRYTNILDDFEAKGLPN